MRTKTTALERFLARRSNPVQGSDPRILDIAFVEGLSEGLSERELVENLLEFANTPDKADGEGAEWIHSRSGPDVFEDVCNLHFNLMELPTAFYDEERAAVRNALIEIINAHKNKNRVVRPAIAERWSELRTRVLLALDRDGGQHLIVLDHLPNALGRVAGLASFAPTPQYAYILLLFLDPTKLYGRDLCLCKYCGRFFFAKLPTGRWKHSKGRNYYGAKQSNYCPDSDHGELAHRAGALERVRESRRKDQFAKDNHQLIAAAMKAAKDDMTVAAKQLNQRSSSVSKQWDSDSVDDSIRRLKRLRLWPQTRRKRLQARRP